MTLTEELAMGIMKPTKRYLGNPLFLSRKKSKDFKFIKEKVLHRIEGWQTKLLSWAGKATLIKTYVLPIPQYTMSTSALPKEICHDMDSMVRRLWWCGSQEKTRFLALKSWESLCKLKSCGVLGFRRFEDFNKALLAKLYWNLA